MDVQWLTLFAVKSDPAPSWPAPPPRPRPPGRAGASPGLAGDARRRPRPAGSRQRRALAARGAAGPDRPGVGARAVACPRGHRHDRPLALGFGDRRRAGGSGPERRGSGAPRGSAFPLPVALAASMDLRPLGPCRRRPRRPAPGRQPGRAPHRPLRASLDDALDGPHARPRRPPRPAGGAATALERPHRDAVRLRRLP